jgi:hypothetical protein
MNILLNNLADFDPVKSVTNKTDDSKSDKQSPFSYVEWLKFSNINTAGNSNYFEQYTGYLNEWTRVKGKTDAEARDYVITSYKTLLKDITLKYTNDEEKRFLRNIDIENPRHLESALPFYASKIKQIALHYAYERDKIKQQKYVASSFGSTAGLERSIKTFVATSHIRPSTDLITTAADPITIQRVVVRELYDISTEFTNSGIEFDVNIYANFKDAIRAILNACRPTLQLTSEVLLILKGDIADTREYNFSTEINNVPKSSFSSYTQELDDLNIGVQSEYLTKLIGSELYTKTSDGTITLLATPDSPWRSLLNRYGPVISNKKNETLKSLKEIGTFFKPQHTGLLTYYSHMPAPVDLGITPGTICPDVNRYGNSYVSGVTGLNIDHIENVEWLKADISNDQLHGDIVITPDVPLFYGYTSTDEIRPGSHHGTSRYTDNFDFFTGHRNDVWANSDVFELEAKNVYDLDARQQSLIVTHDTMYNWRDDVYGNQYSLYKSIEPIRQPLATSFDAEDEFDTSAGCEILDGGDTLLNRPTRFERDYQIYDGGRAPDPDPKIEQFISYVPFPDLRKRDPSGEIPPHNTHYYGVSKKSGKIGNSPITFHGFKPSPGYDKQAYGGLFTDDACGTISSRYTSCAIADNYSFILFTEGPDSDGFYNSSPSPLIGEYEAFEEYANPHFDGFDADIGFTQFGANSGITVTSMPEYDGSSFNAECDFAGIGFEYEVDSSAILFLDTLTVSETKYSDPPSLPNYRKPTLYEQKTETQGSVFFRSYNDKVIDNISTALKPIWDGFVNQRNTAFELIESDLRSGKVINMDILMDCIVIETKDYILIEKVNYDTETTSVLPNKTDNILINTGIDKRVEKCGDWYFDEHKSRLLLCLTESFSGSNGTTLVHPIIHSVDLNTLHYQQAFPNKDYGVALGQESFHLPDELSGYTITNIDRPILTYDNDTDTYNVSYSGYLSGSEGVKYSIFTSDYKQRKLNFDVVDSAVYHGAIVDNYTKPGKPWDDEIDTKMLRLEAGMNETPTGGQVTYKSLDSKDFIGYSLSGRGLDIILDCKKIPVGESKIIDIMFDAGDGSKIKRNQRRIEVDFVDVSFDITKLPDQSDFGDPRKDRINHIYEFNSSVDTTITSTVTALYSDYSKMIFTISIDTSPSTVASAYNGLKLINTKSFIDMNNKHSQLLVLEAQNPQCVTNVIIPKG